MIVIENEEKEKLEKSDVKVKVVTETAQGTLVEDTPETLDKLDEAGVDYVKLESING